MIYLGVLALDMSTDLRSRYQDQGRVKLLSLQRTCFCLSRVSAIEMVSARGGQLAKSKPGCIWVRVQQLSQSSAAERQAGDAFDLLHCGTLRPF